MLPLPQPPKRSASTWTRTLLPLLPSVGLLAEALQRRDLGLLEKYGDGLALIEPAFTLADAGTGRLYEFPVGFAPRLEVHERQLAGLLSSRAPTGPTGFEDYACEMLGSPLESALAFLGMPELTTNGRDTPSARAVRSAL